MSVDRKRLSGRYSALTATICTLLIGLFTADTIRAGGFSDSVSNAVRSSDLVIIGRVVGVIDQKPSVTQRKAREVHWVDVVKVLKGSNEAGERFAVRPMGRAWQDGKDYILFLQWGGSNFANARYLAALDATGDNIAFVERDIAAQGVGPTPRRIYWLRLEDGLQDRPITEFIVTEDTRFAWSRLPIRRAGSARTERLRGALPKPVLEALIHQVEDVPKATADDDADRVTVHWRDAGGVKRTKPLGSPSRAQTLLILQAVERLARRHQQR